MPGDEQVVQIGGRRLRLSRLDKVLYPETGTTKGEVIDYFTRIAPLMIPHIAERPVTRKRWPEGVDHPPFFGKDLEPGAPDWVRRLPIEHSGGPKYYPLVDDMPTLVYLAQVASLELHVPQWRFTSDGDRGMPDRLVLDLDPGPGMGLSDCAEVARWVRAILSDMGLEAHPVTSGSKGIHVYAPLDGRHTSEQASAVAKELAQALEADHPDIVVSRMAKDVRAGRVFLDWSQNNQAKTTIAPYSLRGRERPTVAAPRTWEELDDPDLRQLEFHEVLDRAEHLGDPMAGLGFRAGARAGASGPLSAYIAKRDAQRTPEPVPGNPLAAATPPGEQPRFVIQEHHARRLHWDFRLEHDGVFVSWAVPRGVPPTPGRNSLAVMTEDHPLEYGSFEGTIPRGEYGGGTVTIWDDGRYEPEKWRDDEVIVTLHGRAGGPLGTVRVALIRTQGEGERSSWLLHRTKTDAEGRPQPDGAPVAPSEQADASGPVSSAGPTDASGPAPGGEQGDASVPVSDGDRVDASGAVPDGATASASAASGAAPPGGSTTRADRAPMLTTSASPALAARRAGQWGAWAEVKWDGIRAIGVWDGTALRLYARSGTDITARYPEITGGFRLEASSAVIDGEIIALDASGRPSFSRLQHRMHLTKPREIAAERERTPVRYHVFDVIAVDGRDIADDPLSERREALERIATAAPETVAVPPVLHDVDEALALSRRLGLEGIVVKNPASRYRRGERSEEWLKVKITRAQEVVIGGVRPGRGGRTGSIGSLLLGIPSPAGLRYAGRVGTGFSDSTLKHLEGLLRPLWQDDDPFVGVPPADARDALWVRPELVGEVEYAEFTPSGILRHARWRGLRPDKTPAEVRREG